MSNILSKEINLLYTHIDGNGNFLPNGNELGIEHTVFSDGYNFLATHVFSNEFNRKEIVKINKEHIKNFDKNKKYFYVISHPSLSLNECLESKFIVNENILQLSKKYNNIFIVFLYEHEPDNCELFPKLINYIKNYGLDEEMFIVINNNSMIHDIKKKYETKIKVHKAGFLPYSSFRVLNNLDVQFNKDKNGKFFICRNRTPKQHRLSLILQFHITKLLDDINYSFVPETESRPTDIGGYFNYFDSSFIEENIELINFINSHTKYDDYEVNLDWFDKETNYFTHGKDLPPIFLVPELVESFKNSYFNIITESNYDYPLNTIHITEKSLRPFYYYQFPLFLSSKNHVSYLKNYFGFDVFDDVINHSYDLEENPIKRMSMLIEEIKRINNNKQFFIDFYENNQNRFENNKKNYKKIAIQSKEDDFNFFWNLL